MTTATKKIQMVDLKGQYLKIKKEVDAAIAEVIDNTAFINGPAVKEFQADMERLKYPPNIKLHEIVP